MKELLLYSVPALLTAGLIALLCLMLLTNLYDVVVNRRARNKPAAPTSPSVTVLVDVYDLKEARQSLDSMGESDHRNFDVVVIDSIRERVNSAALKKLVSTQQYTCRYYRPRKAHDYESRLKLAYARSRKGQGVLVLARGSAVAPNALTTITRRHGMGDYGTELLQPLSRATGFIGVIEAVAGSIARLITKTYCMFRPPTVREGMSYVTQDSTIRKGRKVSARIGDGSIRIFGTATYRLVGMRTYLMAAIGLLCTAAIAVVAVFMTLLAVDGVGLEAFIVSWVVAALIGLVAVMFDPLITARQKLESAVCTTFMPILLAISLFVSSVRPLHFKR